MRKLFVLGIVLQVALCNVLTRAQGARFEVVSVKPNKVVGRAGIISGPNRPGQFFITNVSLQAIISYAYNVQDYELVGLPGWTRRERFDITARYPEGANQQQVYREMLQNVLIDRFGLKARREEREMTAYRLVVAKAGQFGPFLVPSDIDCTQWRAQNKPQIGAGGKSLVDPAGVRSVCMMSAHQNWISGGAQSLSILATILQTHLQARVVDHTGLKGTFDIDVAWTAAQDVDPQLPGRPANPAAPLSGDIFTAFQEQLGLKLEPSREKINIVVVESVSQPTPD